MAHSIARSKPPMSRDVAGPLHLDDTTRREWDIVMTRDDRWVRVRAGITDPAEVHQELAAFRLTNRRVVFHAVERTITLRERLVLDADVPTEE